MKEHGENGEKIVQHVYTVFVAFEKVHICLLAHRSMFREDFFAELLSREGLVLI